MENISEPLFTAAFGKEIVKSLLLSAAASAGVFGAMITVGIVISAIQDRKKKSQKTVPTV